MRFPKVSTTNINGLPLGYTEVEYLESTGTQYINTGISGNNPNLKIEVNATNYEFGWCHQNNASGAWVDAFSFPSDNKERVNYGNYSLVKDFNYDRTTRKVRTFDFQTGFYIDGVLSQSFTISNYSSLTPSLPLFARYDFNSSSYTILANSSYTIYSAKIWDNNTLVRDYIPCLDSNNRPCMYDRVEGKPYYNLGTGEFSYGKKIYGVEYLESTGTQYIDTGLKGKSSYDFAYKFNSIIDGNAYGIGGEWESGKSCYLGVIRNNNKFAYHYQNTQSPVEVQTLVNNTDYEVQAHLYSGEQYYVINGIKSTVGTISGTFTSTVNMCLFAVNSSTTKTFSSLKMYFCKIWDNGTLIRDYIPVKDENNVGYMLDKVSHALYENKGTGAFVIGKDTLGKSKAKLIRTKTTVSGLPYGYTEVEYLESNGNQYIDTGIQPTDTYGYRVRNTYTAGAGEQCAIGSMDSGNRFVGIYTSGSANGISGAWGNYVGFLPSYTWVTGTILDVKGNYKNNRKLIIDSTELKDITDTHISGIIENTVYLFARHYGSTITKMRGRMYSAEITNGQDIIYKFIPALDSSNRPCMYDIVEGKPYYNAGTGEFTYGPKIIPVEYIESTGTQYINTGIKLNNNSSVKVDYQLTQAVQSRTGLFGALNMTGSNQGRIGSILSPSNQQLEHGYGAGNDYWQQGMPDTNRHVIYQKKNETYFDGTLIHTFETATFSLVINAYLGNFLFTNYTPAKAKYYSSQWWDGDTLIRDYIPVKDENGVGYMFDKIGHTLYANVGTGSFVVGDEKIFSRVRFIEDTSVISEYTKLKCLISSGTQYIDTGVAGSSTLKIEMDGQKAGTGYGVYFGAGTGNNRIQAIYVNDYNSARIGNITVVQLGPDTEKFNIVVDALSKKVIYNKTSYDFAYTSALTNLNIYIFTRNEGGSFADKATAKCWSFRIWNNNALIRDYIPVLRNSDNKPGMYDRVTKTFFTNQGTGEFTYETL